MAAVETNPYWKINTSYLVHQYFVYIVSDTARRTLYTGFTNNMERRLYEHRNPERSSFTQRYHCVILLHVEAFPDVITAIAREKQIKGWVRRRKLALIFQHNPQMADLAQDWNLTAGDIAPPKDA